jgi:hypothetical protein
MGDYTGTIHRGRERSAADLIEDVVRDLQDIMRSEIRLAKAEVSEKASQVTRASTMFGGAAVAGLLGGMALVTAIIAFIAMWLPVWASALIVGFTLSVAAFGLYWQGKVRLANFTPVPEQTVETIKEDVEWVKQRTK